MIPASEQRRVLHEVVPKITKALIDEVDKQFSTASVQDKRGMATSILSHVLAALLAQQTPEEQANFAHMIGELIRQRS